MVGSCMATLARCANAGRPERNATSVSASSPSNKAMKCSGARIQSELSASKKPCPSIDQAYRAETAECFLCCCLQGTALRAGRRQWFQEKRIPSTGVACRPYGQGERHASARNRASRHLKIKAALLFIHVAIRGDAVAILQITDKLGFVLVVMRKRRQPGAFDKCLARSVWQYVEEMKPIRRGVEIHQLDRIGIKTIRFRSAPPCP